MSQARSTVRDGVIVVDGAEQPADRRRAETEPGHLDIAAAETDALERLVGHGGLRLRHPTTIDATPSPTGIVQSVVHRSVY